MRIVVVGCGPKALAIYAKARYLDRAHVKVPEVLVLEQYEVAAHWRGGDYGFTDGDHPLGTPPEKDIGYPYDSEHKGRAPDIDKHLFELSWISYKIAHGSYADWTDRDRPRPRHREWAEYLQWVADRVKLRESGHYHQGELRKILKRNDRWLIQYDPQHEQGVDIAEIECDAVVFTGPGKPKELLSQVKNCAYIMDGRTFWTQDKRSIFEGWGSEKKKMAVIGAGETAAAVVCALLKVNSAANWSIDVYSHRGTLYSRGEGYHENRYFSDPLGWEKLSVPLREELIERTDRGVLSVDAMRTITKSNQVSCKHGHVTRASWNGKKPCVKLQEEPHPTEYDCVIVAFGFDPIPDEYFEKDEIPTLTAELPAGRRSKEFVKRCAEQICADLSVCSLKPKVYLPMLAGLMQGPGFPGLSCLGRLSDRILRHAIDVLNP